MNMATASVMSLEPQEKPLESFNGQAKGGNPAPVPPSDDPLRRPGVPSTTDDGPKPE
jgi:hypothetical protein